jgi:hypothetical protein
MTLTLAAIVHQQCSSRVLANRFLQSAQRVRHSRRGCASGLGFDQGKPPCLHRDYEIDFQPLLVAKVVDLWPTAAIDLRTALWPAISAPSHGEAHGSTAGVHVASGCDPLHEMSGTTRLMLDSPEVAVSRT